MQLVYKDADKPFLLLMGAEDKELPSTSWRMLAFFTKIR
jgi:hypothetical protein